MLYDENAVRDNLRNREGRRVFYLGRGDQLTSTARDYLTRERIEILPAERAVRGPKPEHMTHLNGDCLVEKTHPRIAFRGKLDSLEGELILCQLALPELKDRLGELLALAREIMACDVLEKPLEERSLWGLTQSDLRRRSHFPQEFYGQPHFMPGAADGMTVARLNRLRTQVRETELAAAHAYPGGSRGDLLRALNRMSSGVYLLMIEEKGNAKVDS